MDVRCWLDQMPSLALDGDGHPATTEDLRARATGTEDVASILKCVLVPALVPAPAVSRTSESSADTSAGHEATEAEGDASPQVHGRAATRTAVAHSELERAKGLEPSTFSLGS